MGDYTKLIVTAELEVARKDLEAHIEELSLSDSACHCEGVTIDIQESYYPKGKLNLNLVGQTKYGRGQTEFLDWLEPFVTQGCGPGEVWAIQFNEYKAMPNMRHKSPMEDQ